MNVYTTSEISWIPIAFLMLLYSSLQPLIILMLELPIFGQWEPLQNVPYGLIAHHQFLGILPYFLGSRPQNEPFLQGSLVPFGGKVLETKI